MFGHPPIAQICHISEGHSMMDRTLQVQRRGDVASDCAEFTNKRCICSGRLFYLGNESPCCFLLLTEVWAMSPALNTQWEDGEPPVQPLERQRVITEKGVGTV